MRDTEFDSIDVLFNNVCFFHDLMTNIRHVHCFIDLLDLST